MSRPRVLLVSGTFPEMRCGVGDYTARLAAQLAPHEQVHVLTSCGASDGPPGVTVHARMERWSRAELGVVEELLDRVEPDLVHLQFPSRMGVRDRGYLPHALPGLLRRRGVPLVVTLHELAERRLRFRARAAWIARGAGAIVYVTEEDRRVARRWPGLARATDAVVPIAANLLPSEAAPRSRAELRAELGIADALPLAVHFGVLDADRGLDLVDAVAAELAGELHVVVVGAPAPGADPRLARTPAAGARRLGPWPAAELGALLTAADLGLFPFPGGASGRRGSLLAAMAHGLPVVTTRGAHLPASWSDGAGMVLVPARDRVAFVDAVRALAGDAERRARLGARAAELAATRSWPEIGARVRAVHATVLGAPA